MTRKLIAVLLVLAMALTLLPLSALACDSGAAAQTTAVATSGTCGTGLTWSYTGGILTIKGTGTMKGYSAAGGSPPWAACFPTTVIIMSGVKNISNCAFLDGIYITSITIPISVTTISSFAFHGCSKLTDIYYDGTKAQWNQIAMASNTELSSSVTIHYGGSKDGWTLDGSTWYYYQDGKAATGWQKIDGTWYYLNSSGAMTTGWQKVGGSWYYMNSSGAMQSGWQKISGKWYYLNTAMVTGWQKISGSWYYFGTNGVMTTGWQKVSGKWYYLGTGGAMQTGWQKIDGKWYYLSSEMKTGWQKVDGTWYYLNNAMVTGWQKIDGNWYYFDNAMTTGWKQISGSWYYFGTNGAMVSGCTMTIDGKDYTFDDHGVWTREDTGSRQTA